MRMFSKFKKAERLTLLTLFISTFLFGCAKSRDFSDTDELLMATNIVGGTDANKSFQQKNGIVALSIETTRGSELCAGSLISRRIVLTAAHCVADGATPVGRIFVVFTNDFAEVRGGSASHELIRQVIHKEIHTDYGAVNRTTAADIALLLLDRDAPAGTKTVTLSQTAKLAAQGQKKVIQVGYGRTLEDRTIRDSSTGRLRYVTDIEILTQSSDGTELLLKEDGKGSCTGDSGGPAFVSGPRGVLQQIGLNSRGTNPESCIGQGIYTNTIAYLPWIREKSEVLNAFAAHHSPAPTAGN